MDLVIIFGPQAVGKMTVGEELQKKTGLKLFHNHMTIDLLLQLFPYDEARPLIKKFRNEIFEAMAKSDQRGMIFTYVWDFDMKEDWEYIAYIYNVFEDHNVYFVELESGLETRLQRNVTHNRLEKKWTKRDTKTSNVRLVKSLEKHRLTSNEGEVPYDNYIKINNEHISAKETSSIIVSCFDLECV